MDPIAAKDGDTSAQGDGPAGAAGANRPEPGHILEGTIVEADEDRLTVDLPGGHRGIARLSGGHLDAGGGPRLQPGQAVLVRVLGVTAERMLRLEWLSPDASTAEVKAFDQEIDRLSDALRRPFSAPSPRSSNSEPALERRISGWIGDVGRGFERLKAHRADRLSREFYDEGEDGGGGAPGRRGH